MRTRVNNNRKTGQFEAVSLQGNLIGYGSKENLKIVAKAKKIGCYLITPITRN